MKKKTTVILIIVLALAIVVTPLVLMPGAEFEGSDDAGVDMIYEITDDGYEAWFEPVIETLIGGELSEGMETLILCIQAGIGIVILAFCFRALARRRKDNKEAKGK
jgi:cobalt/nickel transport protein